MKLTPFKTPAARTFYGAVIGVLGIIGAQRQQAWANDIAFRETIFKTDFASAGAGGMRNTGRGTIILSGVTGEVSRAWLYWAGPMNTTNPAANASITLNGAPITGANIGFSDDNCWGYGNSVAYRADVTAFVAETGNGNYALAGALHQGTNINANGASLLVFYHDSDPANDRDIVVFDGNDSNAMNPYDANGWNISLPGIKYTSGKASLQMHVSDGQSYLDKAILLNNRVLAAEGPIFQGTTVRAANNGPINNGNLWDIKSWDVTNWLTVGENTLSLKHAHEQGSDCVALVVAAINLPAGAAPDQPNHPPAVIGEPEVTVHSRNPIPLEATASDPDGDALTCAFRINGILIRTINLPSANSRTGIPLREESGFDLGRHLVTFTVDDGRTNASHAMIVNVTDNTPPVLNLPPNMVVPTDPGKNTAVVTCTVTATDDFPGVTVLSLPPSGSAFPLGITTVNATAVDGSGNVTKGSFTITVIDSTPPMIACPPNIIRAADLGTNVALVSFNVTATDNVPGVMVACEPPSGSLFPIGVTIVNCMARDVAGNTASCMFTVTVIDTQPPVITGATNRIVANDLGQCAALVNYIVTVTDNAPGATLVCLPPSGSTFPYGTNTVFCRAIDAAGNTASNAFTVTVLDTEKPVLQMPADITLPACTCNPAIANYTVRAADNCSAARVTCTPPSGSTFPRGTNIVTCTAADAAGNTARGSFKVIVRDTQAPVIRSVTPSCRTICRNDHRMVTVTFSVCANDNCPGALTSKIISITSNEPEIGPADCNNGADWQILGPLKASLRAERFSTGTGRIYTITVECKDAAGNASTKTTTVTVRK